MIFYTPVPLVTIPVLGPLVVPPLVVPPSLRGLDREGPILASIPKSL